MFKETAVAADTTDLSAGMETAHETKPLVIGISGGDGSFTEMAAKQYCHENDLAGASLVYLTAVGQVLEALETGAIERAIFAIENRIGGVVLEYLPAILKHRCKFLQTFEYSVHQMLMVQPKVSRENVTEIVSQKQALEQCHTYLRTRWAHVPHREYIDTATAARDLRIGKLLRTAAVIGSKAAARRYDLDILEGPIQDDRYNYTTFIVADRLE